MKQLQICLLASILLTLPAFGAAPARGNIITQEMEEMRQELSEGARKVQQGLEEAEEDVRQALQSADSEIQKSGIRESLANAGMAVKSTFYELLSMFRAIGRELNQKIRKA